MRLHLLAIGPVRTGPERELLDDYLSRVNRAGPTVGLRGVQETELAVGGGQTAEAERLLARVPEGAYVAALDPTGRQMTSPDLAQWLARLRDDGTADLCFLIGGAEGHGQEVAAAAHLQLAFGVQTWPHKLVRVVLAEQLYRAATILAGTPYHKA